VNLQKDWRLSENIDLLSQEVMQNVDPDLMNIILIARLQCRHFGETAYPQSYIDLAWFFERFYNSLGRRERYRDIRDRITEILVYLNEQYIIEKWIGHRRAPNLRQAQSYGGHGVGFYFPSSTQDHLNNDDLRLFFERGSGFTNLFTRDNSWHDLIFAFMAYRQDLGILAPH
jgi:hypothetical protein